MMIVQLNLNQTNFRKFP